MVLRGVGTVFVVLLAAVTAACGAPGVDPAAPPGSAAPATATPSATASPATPVPPVPPSSSAARVRTGAAADVPIVLIMRQLARRAERIAKNIPMEAPTPADVDRGTNRALGYQLMLEFGFPAEQWAYLDALWHRESGWNHLAENPSSGAYGIPQSLPAEKMAVVGPDWRTNPETQIQWGLAYIAARYGSPQQAWAHSERVGWY